MKNILPAMAVALAAVVLAAPVLACERHLSHASMTTAEAVPTPPPPTVVIESAAQSSPAPEIKTEGAMSQPMGAAYEGCNRMRKDQTVYLTQ